MNSHATIHPEINLVFINKGKKTSNALSKFLPEYFALNELKSLNKLIQFKKMTYLLFKKIYMSTSS